MDNKPTDRPPAYHSYGAIPGPAAAAPPGFQQQPPPPPPPYLYHGGQQGKLQVGVLEDDFTCLGIMKNKTTRNAIVIDVPTFL
ncbi:hypothetical protein CRUP_027812 [Coryphaenoides rupestris]|nr:hypothetical protein CRUP_027812 [Coryphaenoides rupestris]